MEDSKKQPKLSIIVPVFNAEKYLEKCINSIINQTFKEYELLLIDDNSQDSFFEICKQYEKRDSRIHVFHREENGGIFSARNDGLKYARGSYVTFVDNDDWLDMCMYEKLMNVIEKHNVDFVSCGFKEIVEGENKFHKHKEDGYYTQEEIRNNLIYMLVGEQKISCAVWKSIFKKEIIDKNELYFRKSKVKDDFYFIVEYLLLCNSVEYISGDYYNYLIRENSTIHTVGLENELDCINTPKIIFEIFERCGCLSKRFYTALGMEYITSILRIGGGRKENFKKSMENVTFRKYMFWKNICGLPWKFQIIYILAKLKKSNILWTLINRKNIY